MLGLGILGGSSLALREARRRGIGMERMSDYVFWAALVFLVVGRIAQCVAVHGFQLLTRPWVVVTELSFGIHFTAGLVAVALFSLWFIYDRSIVPSLFVDALTPAVALTLALSHLGSDVFGRSTSLPWAVQLGEFQMHPVQLYAAIGFYTIFTILWRMRRATRYDGQLFVGFVTMTAWLMWILSFFREVGERSMSPWVLFFLAMAASLMAVLLYMNSPRPYGLRRRTSRFVSCIWGAVFYSFGLMAMVLFFFARVR